MEILNKKFFNRFLYKGFLLMTVCAVIFWSLGPLGPGLFVKEVHAGVPTYSGGGPGDGQTFVPLLPLIDVTASEALTAGTVNTTNVTLYPCTGATDASACASPDTATNLCNSVTLTNSTRIECVLNASLAANTTYKFTAATGVQSSATSQGAVAALVRIFRTSSFDPNNNTTPPKVQSTIPQPGNFTFPTNGNIVVEFSDNMLADGTANAVTNATNILLQTASAGQTTGNNICANSGCTLTFSSGTKKLTIDPASNRTASTDHILTITSNVRNNSGIAMGGGNYLLFFRTGTTTDDNVPTVINTFPTTVTSGSVQTINPDIPDLMIAFSEGMDEATLTSSNVTMFKDDGTGGGTADDFIKQANEPALASSDFAFFYNSVEKSLRIGFKTLLTANKRHCVTLTGGGSGIKDAVGNALATQTRCFQAGATVTDTTGPTVMFADADNFRVWIQYSEPVDTSDAANTQSVLRKANYTLENPVGVTVGLANATLTYRPEAMALEITGLGLQTNQQFKVTVTNVKDRAGNAITANGTTNVGQGTVLDSASTGGFLGGFEAPDFQTNTDFASFWENPKRCAPRSKITSKSSTLECEFPTPAALTTGATIVLTFPTGFDISQATTTATSTSYLNKDINGFGPGTTVVHMVERNTSLRTVTLHITHTGTVMGAKDQLNFELSNVLNPSTPGERSVSAVVKNSSGVKLGQTINFAPFSLGQGGSRTLSGKVCKGSASSGACAGGDTGISGVTITLESFGSFGAGGTMGGFEATTTKATGSFSFTNLSDGQYGIGLFLDPSTASNVMGGGSLQMITISGSNVTGVDFKLLDVSSSGKTLTVSITGGPASTDMDIFCFAPGDFQFSAPVMKKVTTNVSGAVTGTMKVRASTTYECGVGPHIPFESFMSGGLPPVPDFTFMPPPPQTVVVGTADLSISFALVIASAQIKGKVTDGSNTNIANVFVDARPLGCFDTTTGGLKDCMGGFAQSKSDGTFVLNVTNGIYEIGACSPGMPCSEPVEITVKSDTDSGATDGNSTADVYKNGTLLTGTGLTMKLAKTGVTISGQVLDENGSAIKYAFVDAEKVTAGDSCTSFTPTGGFSGSPTDSSGNYTLYVSNGTYKVRANSPAYGEVGCSVITVASNTSKSGQNIQASASDYGTISGTVTKGGSAVQGAFVTCYGSSGSNQAVSGADGTYTMKLKAGSSYSCDGFLHGVGPLTPVTGQTVTAASATTVNLSVGNPGTITVTTSSAITDAFCDARDSNGRGDGTGQNSSGVYTIKVPAGTYTVSCSNPKYGIVGSKSVTVEAGGSHAVDFSASAPTLYTVSGRITDGTNNLSGASVTFTDTSNGRIAFVQSDSTSGTGTNISVSLPSGSYKMVASKQGYVDSNVAETVSVSSNVTFTTRALTQASVSVSITVQSSGSNYTGSGRVIAADTHGNVATAEIDKTATTTANATLKLANGTWSVNAYADNGKKTKSAITITVTNNSASPSSVTLDLDTAISGFTATETKQQSVTPKTGGIFKDTTIGSNFEVNIPSSVLSTSDSNSGTIATKKDPSLAISTPNKNFVGSYAIDITPKDANGKELKEFSSSGKVVTLKIPYTDADVTAAGVDESQLIIGSWNDAAQEWETFPTIVDTTNNILTVQVSHFSSFGPVGPSGGGGGSSSSSSSGGGGGGGGGGGFTTNTGPKVSVNSLVINGGVNTTESSEVALTLSAQEAVDMMIANSSDFSDVTWRPYSQNTSWTLSPGAGSKIVYAKFRDVLGYVSSKVLSSITLQSPFFEPTKKEDSLTGVAKVYLMKEAESPAVYYVSGGVKRPFPNGKIFEAHGFHWADIKVVRSLVDYELGPAMTYPADFDFGERMLVKGGSASKVYVVSEGKLRWIEKGEVFIALGYQWDRIHEISDEKLAEYIVGQSIPIAVMHPEGALVKYERDSKVYLIKNGRKQWVVSAQAFVESGFDWDDILTISSQFAYADGPTIGVLLVSDSQPVVLGVSNRGEYMFTQYLKAGDIGTEVRELQTVLKDLGYFIYPTITGHFGPVTESAVIEFQKAHGIEPLGVVGPMTRSALNNLD